MFACFPLGQGVTAVADAALRPQGLLEHLPLAACVCDREGAIVQYNARAAQLWRCEPQPGEKFCSAVRLVDASNGAFNPQAVPIMRVLRHGVPEHNRELVLERSDGSRVPVLSNTAPLLDEQGRVIGAIELLQDITDRKRSEEARRVAERMAASTRLANSVVEQMHPPLSCMSKLLEALRQDATLSAEARSYAQLAEEEVSRLAKVAREMRHWSSAAG
jgi:transcriptional regulator with PAS, ATPase and Fis domain